MKQLKYISTIILCLATFQVHADHFRVLDFDSSSVINELPWATVITDQLEWENFYYQEILGCDGSTPIDGEDPCLADPPVVDFDSHQVIVGGPGAKPSSDYQVLVSNVDSSGSTLHIHITEVAPCLGLTVIDYPITGIVVEKTDKPLSFSLQSASMDCP
jgi:hypothetical protein